MRATEMTRLTKTTRTHFCRLLMSNVDIYACVYLGPYLVDSVISVCSFGIYIFWVNDNSRSIIDFFFQLFKI